MSVSTIGVIGAGVMGSGIAQVAAIKGIDVILLDHNETAVKTGIDAVESRLNRVVTKGNMTVPQKEAAVRRIKGTTGYASAEDIDKGMKLGCKGPLALADMIGLDVPLAVMQILHDEFGDSKYRPCPLLKELVAAGPPWAQVGPRRVQLPKELGRACCGENDASRRGARFRKAIEHRGNPGSHTRSGRGADQGCCERGLSHRPPRR
jgi:3-hydroxyacyl-CoA dehydrogenase